MDYDGHDFYCDIAIPGKVELKKEYESDSVLAYHHTRPFWPVHIVVVPKRHIASFTALTETDTQVFLEMVAVLKQLAKRVEDQYGAAAILTNLGQYQDSKHLHIHIYSGDKLR